VDAVAPPPPHAAIASGASANPAALARIAIGLDRLSIFTPLRWGSVAAAPATSDGGPTITPSMVDAALAFVVGSRATLSPASVVG
jgi:hypothetical protein